MVQGWPVLFVFIIGTALTIFVAQRTADAEREVVHSRFEQEARSRILLVEELIQGQMLELDALRRFISLESELTRSEFSSLARLSDRIPMTVAWIESVSADRLDAYLERMDYYYHFRYHLRRPAALLASQVAKPPRHFPVSYQESSVPEANLVGVDTAYLEDRVRAYERAMVGGVPVLISGIRNLDDPGDASGVLVVAPVFHEDAGRGVTDRHFGTLRGFVTMGFRLSDLVQWLSTVHQDRPGMILSFRGDADPASGSAGPMIAGLSYTDTLALADGAMAVTAVPERIDAWQPRPTAIVVLLTGITGTVLVAALLGTALYRRRQAEASVERRTVELRGALDALSELEARWQFALEGSGDGVWDYDIAKREVFFSDGWKSMLGYTRDEIGSGPDEWVELIHPDDVAACRHDLMEHIEGKVPYYENVHRLRCKDGSYKWILDRGKVIEWAAPGQPARIIGTHSDISHVKQTELELRETNAFLSGLLASAESVAIITASQEGTVTLFNRGAEALLGYRAEDVVDKVCPTLFYDHDELEAWGHWLSAQAGRTVHGFEVLKAGIEQGHFASERWTFVCKNGERRKVQLTLSKIRDGEGEARGYLAIATDMTDYLRAVDALEQNDRLLQDLTANVPGVIYQFLVRPDDTSCFPYISDGVRRVFEISPEEANRDARKALARIHPADIEEVDASIRKSAKQLVPWVSEFRVRLPSYGERWLRGESTPRRTPDGGTVWHGYISDISEIKKLEFQLREQATIDPLTGAFNRRHLESYWKREMARYRRQEEAFSMILLDIDHFKTVNDAHGHDVGDEVLVSLGRLLRSEVRSTDVVYRLGGEEFLVLCENTELDGARRLAELLRDQLRQRAMPFPGRVTASFGVVEVELDEPMAQAFKRLDELLYLAKANGRDQVMSSPYESAL